VGGKTQINYKFVPTSLFRGPYKPVSSLDEWATTKQACRDKLVVYFTMCFSSHIIYFALLWCIEHCFTKIKFYTLNYSVYTQGHSYGFRAKYSCLHLVINILQKETCSHLQSSTIHLQSNPTVCQTSNNWWNRNLGYGKYSLYELV